MVETIISYLNAKLEGTGYFHSLYCLAEKKKEPREEGDFVYPATYVGGGDLELVEFDSAGFAYFRKNGDFGQTVVTNDLGQKQLYSIDLPFRLVAMVRRQDVVTDDAYSPDRLARELASILTFRNGDLRTFLQASRVTVTSGSWTTNPEQIWTDETEGTGRIEPDYSRAFIAMDVTVNVLADEGCIRSACTDEPDILRLFDFCDPSVVARLTEAQVTCLQDALCEACEDATVTVNTAPFGTAPSGGGLNVPVVNGGANPVGSKQGSDWVVANNATFINGTQVTDQEAEVDANIFVTLDGAQSGTWNAGLQTWEVTGGASGSVAVTVSDAAPDFGDSITITATPTGLTPTSYLFFAFDGTDITFIAEQAGAIANWTVSLSGTFEIYVLATDGSLEVYGLVSVTATSGLICDQIGVLPIYGVGLVRLSTTYTGAAASVMRSSDSAIASIPFDGEFIDEAALIAHVGVGSGFTAVLPNQFGGNDAQQGIAANIPSVVITGTIQRINGVACLFFDGTSDELAITTNVTFKHAFVVAAKTGNVNFAQYVLGGTGQGLSMGGTFDASFNNIQVFTSGGSLVSAVNNTTPHQISFRMGVAGAGRLRIDGVTAATGTTSASMSINKIGGRPDAALRHVGRFGCSFMYTNVLTDAQELILEAATKAVFGTP